MTVSQRFAPPIASLSNGARAAGAVIATAYLLGLVPGPVVSVVGGLALVTLGRSLLLGRTAGARSALTLAILAGALGVAALRWGTLSLPELRGVQAVLGPTVLVGPELTAVACGLAFAGGLFALGAWAPDPRPADRFGFVWSGFEIAVGSLALVTVFFDPARSSLQGAGLLSSMLDLALWLGVVVVAGAAAVGIAWLNEKWPDRLRWIGVGCAGIAVVLGAALIAGTL